MTNKPRWPEMLALNAYWFGLSYLWNGWGPVIQPLLVASLVGESVKGSATGLLTAIGMIVAIVVQPVAGAISDRSTNRWGRRRPFMVGGTLADMIFLGAILAIALGPQRAVYFWLLVVVYFGLQVASNVSHGPYQGLIPDRVPPERWGTASGVKQLAEMLGVIVTSLAMKWFLDQHQMPLAIVSMMLFLLLTLALTLTVRERPLPDAPSQEPLFRAVLGTFLIDLRRYAGFGWLVLSRLFVLVAMNLVRNYILFYIQFILKMSPEEAGSAASSLMAVLGIAILFIVYPAGVLSDRIGRRPLLAFSGLVGAVGSLLLLWARSYTHLLVFGGVLGLSIGVFLSANWALLTDLVPKEEAGRYLGITNLATAGAGVVAGVGGVVLDLFNAQAPGRGFVALYLLAGACYLVGTALLLKVRKVRRAPALE